MGEVLLKYKKAIGNQGRSINKPIHPFYDGNGRTGRIVKHYE